MARDEKSPLYVGQGYGDTLEIERVPNVENVDETHVRLTRDVMPLKALAAVEKKRRKAVDPYGQVEALLLEKAESKWS